MPEGQCKVCGIKWYGWGLPDNPVCECGGKIEIIYPPELVKKPTPDNP